MVIVNVLLISRSEVIDHLIITRTSLIYARTISHAKSKEYLTLLSNGVRWLVKFEDFVQIVKQPRKVQKSLKPTT